MTNQRWIRNMFTVAIAALVFTGCRSGSNMSDAETEALRQQIAQLEQQVSALEQQAAVAQQPQSDAGTAVAQQPQNDAGTAVAQPPQNDTGAAVTQPSSGDANTGNVQPPSGNENTGNAQPSGNTDAIGGQQPQSNVGNTSSGSLTTYTMEELGSMVDAYVAKANAEAPGGTTTEIMEQFFALKKEADQIDDVLDRHEDELELLYKKQSLTRDEYKRLERELDLLEDKLDDAEDYLEFIFGIDD